MIKPEKKQINNFSVLIGISSSILAIILMGLFLDIDEVKLVLTEADYRNLPWVIVCFFGTMFAISMSWKTVLSHKISFSRSFWTLNQGYILNNFLPFRLGELGRAFSLSITENIPVVKGITSILIDRIFDITILGGILLSFLPLFPSVHVPLLTLLFGPNVPLSPTVFLISVLGPTIASWGVLFSALAASYSSRVTNRKCGYGPIAMPRSFPASLHC